MKIKLLTGVLATLCATSSFAEDDFKFEAANTSTYLNFNNADVVNNSYGINEDLVKLNYSEDGEAGGGPKVYTEAEIIEMMNNPLGELWLMYLQHDMTVYEGDAFDNLSQDDLTFHTTQIMPVMAFQLTEDIKYIFRPVIPIHTWETPDWNNASPIYNPPGTPIGIDVDTQTETELGDIVLWNAFASNDMAKPPNIWGVGVTAMLDTAGDDRFGTNATSVGPMALALHVGEPGEFIYGTVVQHWWDVAGDGEVNMTNIQYIGYYRIDADSNFGIGSPNITINWDADSDDRYTIPVGLGYNTTVKIGPAPVKIGVELYKYVESPDAFGAEWGLRFIFSPVVPSPGFSKNPWF